MPARRETDAQNLQVELAREVTKDAAVLAEQIFSMPEPDVKRVTDEDIELRYRQAFLQNDRGYLMSEAQRDPTQFMKAVARLGVQMPGEKPVTLEPPLPTRARSNVRIPAPPPSALPQVQSFMSPPVQPTVPLEAVQPEGPVY
jgi:hypothetical protein